MPATSSASRSRSAVELWREVEPVEHVERAADDERVHDRAQARPLAERGREHEHRERQATTAVPKLHPVIRDRLVEDVPGAESDIGAHRQQLAQPYRSSAAVSGRSATRAPARIG